MRVRSPCVRARAGTSLVELLVALPLAALLGALAVALLLLVARSAHTQGGALTTSRELRHAIAALVSDLELLAPGDLQVVQDSLIEFASTHAVAVVCGITANGAALLGELGAAQGSPLTGLRAGDELRHWPLRPGVMAGSDPALPPTEERVAVGTAQAIGSMPCGPAASALSIPQWRVTGDSARLIALEPGAPVRITRHTRYVHYRSDGQWWLGRRTRDITGWDVVQPVAGPLHSATDGGLRISGLAASGATTPNPALVTHLALQLRAPRLLAGRTLGVNDSVHLVIGLRGTPAQQGN